MPRTALVFPGTSGGPLDEKAIYKACVAAGTAAKPGRVIGPHKLRHTFASNHAARGTPLPVIHAWMGHADIATTIRCSHLCPTTRAAFADNAAPQRGPRLVAGKSSRRRRGVTTGVTAEGGAAKTAS